LKEINNYVKYRGISKAFKYSIINWFFFLMSKECKREILQLIKKINGLIAVIITDREGVPLIKGLRHLFLSFN
jgi:hypothetical protein